MPPARVYTHPAAVVAITHMDMLKADRCSSEARPPWGSSRWRSVVVSGVIIPAAMWVSAPARGPKVRILAVAMIEETETRLPRVPTKSSTLNNSATDAITAKQSKPS